MKRKVTTVIKREIKNHIDSAGENSYVACFGFISLVNGDSYYETSLNFEIINADSDEEAIDNFKRFYNKCDWYHDIIIGKIIYKDILSDKITALVKIEAEETDTTGESSYVIALLCGGEMGAPEFWYTDFQIIHANSEEEAVKKYNEINKCVYYYGYLIGKVINENK